MVRTFVWGSFWLCLTAAEIASAAGPIKVVARDVRALGDGRCVASVAVRYNEPIQNPWQPQSQLLKSSRNVVQCSKAEDEADRLIRIVETNLLFEARRRADDNNTQIRSVKLAVDAHVRSDAASEARLLKVLPAGSRIHVRSVTPIWYAITDARGEPMDGFLHYAELAGDFSEPAPVTAKLRTACNSRVRAQPSLEADVVGQLPCNEPVRVISAGNGWFELIAATGHGSGTYIHGALLNKSPVRKNHLTQGKTHKTQSVAGSPMLLASSH